MRITRLKRIQKNLAFYSNHFGFRKPFQVLIDGTFCCVALKDKLNIQDQLKTFVGEDIKLLTTQCAVLEIEKLGKSVYGAMLIIKNFPVHKCGHENQPVTGSKCLFSMVSSSNSSRYIIATQDRELQETLRSLPGIPLLYFHNKAPTLEAPTEESQKAASNAANALWAVSEFEATTLTKLKEVELGIKPIAEPAVKKRKRLGGPNPLSCKKRKKHTVSSKQCESSGKKKKVRRSKRYLCM